jgi:hypothetical protein
MTHDEQKKFEDDLPGILNALEDWFASQGFLPMTRMMICQIYTATLIRAVSENYHKKIARKHRCQVAGIQFALSEFQRALNGGYAIDGIPQSRDSKRN